MQYEQWLVSFRCVKRGCHAPAERQRMQRVGRAFGSLLQQFYKKQMHPRFRTVSNFFYVHELFEKSSGTQLIIESEGKAATNQGRPDGEGEGRSNRHVGFRVCRWIHSSPAGKLGPDPIGKRFRPHIEQNRIEQVRSDQIITHDLDTWGQMNRWICMV